jgi:hypothetical protein
MLFLVAGLLAIGAQPAAASPGAFRVLFLNGMGSCAGDNTVHDQLAAMPGVARVDSFDGSTATPSVAQLDQYDGVLAHTDCSAYVDPTAIGNNLADYADHGGVVVQYAYTFHTSTSFQIRGRWMSGGYSPYNPGTNVNNNVTLGTFDASSPLMAGVTSLTSADCNTAATLASGATRVALWNNGQEAVAMKGQAVAVNAGIDDTSCTYSGDYARLTLNGVKLLDKHLPTGTAISEAKINRKKRTAKFVFGAPGTLTGFECSLTRPKKKSKKSTAPFGACGSPKLYKHLRKGKYTFAVRALNSNGPDSTPAVRKFKI